MKRALALLLSILMVMGLVACGEAEAPATDGTAEQTPAEKIHITVVGSSAMGEAGSANGTLWEELSAQLVEKCGDWAEFEFVSPGVMGGETAITESLLTGAIDIGLVSDMTVDGYINCLGFAWLPYFISTYEEADELYYKGWINDEITARYAQNDLHRIGVFECGIKAMGVKGKAIKSAEDFKGMKIRTSEVPENQLFLKTLGMLPVAMSNTETATAIQQGTIDAVDTTFYNLRTQGVLELMTDVTLTNHQYSGASIIMSDKMYNTLTEEQLAAVSEVAMDCGMRNLEGKRADEVALREWCESQGIHVWDASDSVKEALTAAGNTVWEEYAYSYGKTADGQEIGDLIMAAAKK